MGLHYNGAALEQPDQKNNIFKPTQAILVDVPSSTGLVENGTT